MHILIVSGPGISLKEPYNSGIEAFMVSFASQLVKEGHTVDVVAKGAEANAQFRLINPFSPSATDNPDYFTRQQQKILFENLDVSGYDLIHFNMFYLHLLEAGQSFNKPTFLTLHSPADEKRVTAYARLSWESDIQFVAISDRVKKQWELALNIDIPLIHNGIDMNLWPVNHSMKRQYLLWSARINEEKNVAAAIRVAQHMQLPLKIAGRIADEQYFNEQVRPHLGDQIEYVGHLTQRELSSLAKNASAYLATATWQEPFGLAALEMLASGVPVVGFNTAVPPSWVHESVLTTPSLYWEDLVPLVKKSSGINPSQCAAFASNMSVQHMTSKYLELYEEVLSQNTLFVESDFIKPVARQLQILK